MQLINVFILFCVQVYCGFPAYVAHKKAATRESEVLDWTGDRLIGLVFRANEIFAIWIIRGFLRYDRTVHTEDTRTPSLAHDQHLRWCRVSLQIVN